MRKKGTEEPAKMETSQIREIIEMMNENNLSELELEQDGLKLKLKKGMDMEEVEKALAVAAIPKALPQPQVITPEVAPDEPKSPPPPVPDDTTDIPSPMVGTFYRSPSPESDSFVKVGDHVEEDTTVCIIEAMKVMNEIKAEVKGTIARVMVDDASSVQYGEPLFKVTPA